MSTAGPTIRPGLLLLPRELAELTIQFYRRNYIEGLFLSSAVLRDPDYTTERMIEALRLLRQDYGFGGYIHAKAIPGADPPSPSSWACWPTGSASTSSCPAPKAWPCWPRTRAGPASWPPWPRSGMGSPSPGRSWPNPPCPPLRPGGPVHSDDRRCHAGERPPHPDAHPGALRQVPSEAGLLLRLYPRLLQLPAPPLPRAFSRPCCVSTGCIRRTGCCGSTTFGPRSCWTRGGPTSTSVWTPSAAGPCATWTSFLWRSSGLTMRPCSGCPASGSPAPSASSQPGGPDPCPSPA